MCVICQYRIGIKTLSRLCYAYQIREKCGPFGVTAPRRSTPDPTCPNMSQRVRTSPNESERVRTDWNMPLQRHVCSDMTCPNEPTGCNALLCEATRMSSKGLPFDDAGENEWPPSRFELGRGCNLRLQCPGLSRCYTRAGVFSAPPWRPWGRQTIAVARVRLSSSTYKALVRTPRAFATRYSVTMPMLRSPRSAPPTSPFHNR